MDKFKFIMYSLLSVVASFIAFILFFVADQCAKFSDAWELGADHHFKKITERA